MTQEAMKTLTERIESIYEKIGVIEKMLPMAVTEEVKPAEKKTKRISAMEEVTPDGTVHEEIKIGNTHDDFLGALHGFSVVNS